jgi:hypothetical protein
MEYPAVNTDVIQHRPKAAYEIPATKRKGKQALSSFPVAILDEIPREHIAPMGAELYGRRHKKWIARQCPMKIAGRSGIVKSGIDHHLPVFQSVLPAGITEADDAMPQDLLKLAFPPDDLSACLRCVHGFQISMVDGVRADLEALT